MAGVDPLTLVVCAVLLLAAVVGFLVLYTRADRGRDDDEARRREQDRLDDQLTPEQSAELRRRILDEARRTPQERRRGE